MAREDWGTWQKTHFEYYSPRCRKQFTGNINLNCSFSSYCWFGNTGQEMANNQLIQSLYTLTTYFMKPPWQRPCNYWILSYISLSPIIIVLTWWSWLHLDSPLENLVGWMGGCALSSWPPPLGFLQSPSPGSNSRWAYEPHTGCPCCSCTIA